MKLFTTFLILVILTGCGSGSDSGTIDITPPVQPKLVQLTANGLSNSVILLEAVSNNSHEITTDGNYIISLDVGQDIYKLEILESNQQYCTLSESNALECNAEVCTAEYAPVCGKKPLAGLTCITTPCDTDRYMTFSNACHATAGNAWVTFNSECGGLESVVSEHIEPIIITNVDTSSFESDNYTIFSHSISGDTLTLTFEVGGGCGSHEFNFYGNDSFTGSENNIQTYAITYKNNDPCDALIRVTKEFDLEPIQEIYRRAYPNASGEISINLIQTGGGSELGVYTFTL